MEEHTTPVAEPDAEDEPSGAVFGFVSIVVVLLALGLAATLLRGLAS